MDKPGTLKKTDLEDIKNIKTRLQNLKEHL
jgi:hypothetical protein